MQAERLRQAVAPEGHDGDGASLLGLLELGLAVGHAPAPAVGRVAKLEEVGDHRLLGMELLLSLSMFCESPEW